MWLTTLKNKAEWQYKLTRLHYLKEQQRSTKVRKLHSFTGNIASKVMDLQHINHQIQNSIKNWTSCDHQNIYPISTSSKKWKKYNSNLSVIKIDKVKVNLLEHHLITSWVKPYKSWNKMNHFKSKSVPKISKINNINTTNPEAKPTVASIKHWLSKSIRTKEKIESFQNNSRAKISKKINDINTKI